MVRREDLAQWGILPARQIGDVLIDGQSFVPLAAITGVEGQLDSSGQTLIIAADPQVFPTVRFARRTQDAEVGRIVPAAFLGYDLALSGWNREISASAYLDTGVSGRWGLLGTTALVQSGGAGSVRLESAFQRDLPDQRIRLVVGDTATRGAEWNRPARFAGIRVGTDFSLKPAEINYPLPTLSGTAPMPSTVELMAAGASQSLEVQPGAFLIDYQPVFNGTGDVTMTIRDGTGMTRRITQSFYTSPRLLRPGLDDFSLEAGFLRENYGRSSFDYGDPFAAAYWRHGLTSNLTLAGRLEAGKAFRMAGAGFGIVLPPLGEFSLAGALSGGGHGNGHLWRAQFQRLTPAYSITATYQRQSEHFGQVGDSETGQGTPNARSELAVAASLNLGRAGDLSASHVEAETWGGSRYSISTLSYSGTIRSIYFNAGARRTSIDSSVSNGLFASISMPLGTRGNASLSADDARTIAAINQAPPNDQGLGYRVAAGREAGTGSPIASASILLRTRAGDIEISGDHNGSGQGFRATARGALVAVSGRIAATPRLDYAFAAVEVDGDADVTLYYENRPVVVKGGRGRHAVLTGLQPYAGNRISIDVDSMPIDAAIEAPEKLVVPGYRQAVSVSFGGASGHPLTVALVDQDGLPLPPGLEVAVNGLSLGRTGFDGIAFIPDSRGVERLTITGPARACEARLPARTGTDGGRIGPVTCVARKRKENVQ